MAGVARREAFLSSLSVSYALGLGGSSLGWEEKALEGVAPPLRVLLKVRHGLMAGRSVRSTLKEILQSHDSSDFHGTLSKWWLEREAGHPGEEVLDRAGSIYRQALLRLLGEGLEGVSVLEALADLEQEMRRAMEAELETFVASLPLRVLGPLILCIFPALALLIFGPLLMKLLEAFQ